jgi:hypothetical protein
MCLGCATAGRDFETPVGPRPGDQLDGPFVVLGLISRNTGTLSRADGRSLFEESVTVNVPPGTELIVPTMRGFLLGFGRTDPEDLSAGTGDAAWHSEDHHLGFAYVNVYVDRIHAVDTSSTPPTQTAVIHVQARLTDDNGDDKWFGDVNYTLICLAKMPR